MLLIMCVMYGTVCMYVQVCMYVCMYVMVVMMVVAVMDQRRSPMDRQGSKPSSDHNKKRHEKH